MQKPSLRNNSFRHYRKRSIGLLISLILIVGGGIWAASAYSKLPQAIELDAVANMRDEVAPPLTSLKAQGGPPGERVEIELVTILPDGFHPEEITRPKGVFIIAVENRSGLEDIELLLDREAGSRLRQVRIPVNKLNWKEGLDLTPGRYVLTEATNPDRKFYINITSN